jgi:hypothetical protein
LNTPKQAQAFLISTKQPEPITEKNQYQKPKPTCGRPSDRLTEHQLKQAMAIVSFDMKKQGKISKCKCPQHGKTALSYRYQKSDGIHLWCEIPGCRYTNHFDEIHFAGQDDEEE